MSEYIIHEVEISSFNPNRGDSDEENLMKRILMKKISYRMWLFFLMSQIKKFVIFKTIQVIHKILI